MNMLHALDRRAVGLLLTAVLLAGCATKPPVPVVPPATAPGKAPTAPPAPPPPAPKPTIASEHRRLADLFNGTPVVVQRAGDNRLRLQVPLRYCFDAGKSTVKPPLAALLDRLAPSLRLQPAFEVRIAASGDGAGTGVTQLTRERAASTRDHLVAHGAPPTRIVEVYDATDDGIELIVTQRAPNPS